MIIAANFKTNHTRSSTQKYIQELIECKTDEQVRFFPPSSAFAKVDLPKNIKQGAQNFYPIQNGSFTGEIGREQLEEFDIKSVLIGHSERREILGESDELIASKFEFAKSHNWEITFCIGEPLNVRQNGLKSVMEYLLNQLSKIDLNYKNLIVAYEPIWAIGTGVSAKKEDIKETLDALREDVKAPLLYGGSVKAQNAEDILSLQNCDGVLVGTASWDIEEFKKIIEKAK